MNQWTGIGNLGADPKLTETPSGRARCRFNVAIDRRFYTGVGEARKLQKETRWIPITIWGDQARSCAKYLQKGSKVAITGELNPYNYTDDANVTHYSFEVIAETVQFLDKIRSQEQETEAPSAEE